MKFGAVATPHIFIFDQDRKLRYQGRIDDNQREELVKTHDARNAIDALLAGKPVPVTDTTAFGCTTKWLSKASGVEQEWARIQAEPVTVDMVGAEDLKKIRANATDKVMLVNLWSTNCAACAGQFFDLETTYRMYRKRAFDLITINTNAPADAPQVLAFLKKHTRRARTSSSPPPDRAGAAGGLGREVEPGPAADDGDRAGRGGALQEGRQDRHPRSAPHDPRGDARHEGLHRVEGLLGRTSRTKS